jgi:hypothetical protein
MRWAEHVECAEERRHVYRVLVVKSKEKRPLGKLRRRWEEHIKIIFNKYHGKTWSGFIWLRIGTSCGVL